LRLLGSRSSENKIILQRANVEYLNAGCYWTRIYAALHQRRRSLALRRSSQRQIADKRCG